VKGTDGHHGLLVLPSGRIPPNPWPEPTRAQRHWIVNPWRDAAASGLPRNPRSPSASWGQ